MLFQNQWLKSCIYNISIINDCFRNISIELRDVLLIRDVMAE